MFNNKAIFYLGLFFALTLTVSGRVRGSNNRRNDASNSPVSGVKPVGRANVSSSQTEAMQYLGQFGYVDEAEARAGLEPSRLAQVIKAFQKFFGLQETGELNTETLAEMHKKRCGVPDLAGNDERFGRRKRYDLQGSKWNKTDLTWRISKYSDSPNLKRTSPREIDAVIKRAFDAWERASGLRFIHSPNARVVDIDIRFVRKNHGDQSPFDGPGTTLAHAFYPQFGGDAHFDDDEKWTLDAEGGIDLLSVAVHEFGHSLGLRHSNKREALMFPTYAGKRYDLRDDDIQGIQQLYGPPRRGGGGGIGNGGRGNRENRRPGPHNADDGNREPERGEGGRGNRRDEDDSGHRHPNRRPHREQYNREPSREHRIPSRDNAFPSRGNEYPNRDHQGHRNPLNRERDDENRDRETTERYPSRETTSRYNRDDDRRDNRGGNRGDRNDERETEATTFRIPTTTRRRGILGLFG